MEQKIIAVFPDFKRTFETINKKTLLNKLEVCSGKDCLMNLIESYVLVLKYAEACVGLSNYI